ncbi:MAG: VOC family protein [Actinomycetota bacterium]
MTVSLGYVSFYVSDVPAAVRFYTHAFGFARRLLTPEEDYGEVDTGATVLSFVSNDLAETNLAAAGGFTRLDASAPPAGATISLITHDVPAALAAAVDAGGRVYTGPVDKPWGQTVAYLIDPHGILVEIATPLPEG